MGDFREWNAREEVFVVRKGYDISSGNKMLVKILVCSGNGVS